MGTKAGWMRLLLFLDTDHISGPARLALDFCVEAMRGGHEVLMLGLVRGEAPAERGDNNDGPNAFVKAMRRAKIPTRVIWERGRFDPGVVRQFRKVLADFRPDIYQSHGYKGSLLGRVAKRS